MGGFGPRPDAKISQPHGHPLWDWGAYPDRDDQLPDYKIAQWAVGALNAQAEDSSSPFFLAVGFFRPHVPMYAPQKWFDLFPREEVELPLVRHDDRDDLSAYAIALTNEKHVSPEHAWIESAGQWEHAVQAYLASTAFADYCLGLCARRPGCVAAAGQHDRRSILRPWLPPRREAALGQAFALGKRDARAVDRGRSLVIKPDSERANRPNFLTFSLPCSNWLTCPRTRNRKVIRWCRC